MIQLVALSPTGQGLLQGGATGTGPFANALMLYQPGDAHGASIPMPVAIANGAFDLVAQFNGAEVAGDLLGYFAEPQATALECNTQVARGPGFLVPDGSILFVNGPGCPGWICASGNRVSFRYARKSCPTHPDVAEPCFVSICQQQRCDGRFKRIRH